MKNLLYQAVFYTVFLPYIKCFSKALHQKNEVIGLPVVNCGVHTIDVMIETSKAFYGQVYTKGYYDHSNCKTNRTVSHNKSFTLSLSIPLSDCGIRRQRTLNPPGILLETTVILMFHNIFLTKDDRSFKVQCHYTESDLEVTRSLDVSTVAPTELPQSSEQLDQEHIPTCKYEVLTAGSNGRAVKYATVGEDVYHKWSCNVNQANMYCMTVHSCTADNGQGIAQQLIDEQGCSLDEFLIHNLNYSQNELSAGQSSSVFKFADQPTVYFSCMIKLFIKENPDSDCPIPQNYCNDGAYANEITSDFPKPPPGLPLNPEDGDYDSTVLVKDKTITRRTRMRYGRDLKRQVINLDVSAPSVDILDIPYKGHEESHSSPRGLGEILDNQSPPNLRESICISRLSLAFSISLILTVTLISIIIHFYLLKLIRTRRNTMENVNRKYQSSMF